MSRYYYPNNEILLPKWHSPEPVPVAWHRFLRFALPVLALALLGFWLFGFYWWPEYKAKQATVLVWVNVDGDGRHDSQGSGVIISPRGYVLTNRHVVYGSSGRKPSKIAIWYHAGSPDKQEMEATIVRAAEGAAGGARRSIHTDWAVLQVVRRNSLPYVVPADKTDFREEEGLSALGFPRAEETMTNQYGPSVKIVRGEITRVDRSEQRGVLRLTHSAATAEGMSGGPVVQRGRLIGLNTAGLAGGSVTANENYALPIYLLKESVFKEYGAP